MVVVSQNYSHQLHRFIMYMVSAQPSGTREMPSLSQVPLSHELNQGKDATASASSGGGTDGKAADKNSEDLTEKNKA